jgi:uncharacterized 2Fe-2S/4Fe-4S cluster protein (DUF4445 family)
MAANETVQVEFEPIGRRIDVAAGTDLLNAAQAAGISLASSCGGIGNCGQCRVMVLAGSVSPPTENEITVLSDVERQAGQRLACSTNVLDDVKVDIPTSSLITAQRLQLAGDSRSLPVDPIIHAHPISVPAPTLHDPRSDVTRVAEALAAQQPDVWTEPAVVHQLTPLARQEAWQLTAYLRQAELVGVVPQGTRPVGMAVDLGTTKIAAYLVDLATGEELAARGAMNPQIGYGEDVISRLAYVRRHPDGGQMLADLTCARLDDLLGDLTQSAGIARQQIADLCVVGNTAMIHLLLALPVDQLAVAPFVAATSAAIDVKAREMGLHAAPGAYVHVLPSIGGFVGADHVAMLLASDLDRADHVVLAIDIGTNSEIALAKPDGAFLTSTSCASGPAFEGAHIGDGMRAAAGAIEAVELSASGLRLKTVEDAPAVGLCGSGIVDAVAELLRWSLINPRGRFARDSDRVSVGRHGPELLLVPAERSGNGQDIAISQRDVNEIQLAKGAIRAGLDALLQVTETRPEEVDEVVIAGAFGSYLNIRNALAIGLLPHLPRARYRQVGNAAGVGAKWALVSQEARSRARTLAEETRYLELTTLPKFNRLFALGMLFPTPVPNNNQDAVQNEHEWS